MDHRLWSDVCDVFSFSIGSTRYGSDIQRFSGFKFKTALSKNENNFALSICFRRTLIRQSGNFYEINELDPWQERIIKNNTEFHQKAKKKTFQKFRKVFSFLKRVMIGQDIFYESSYIKTRPINNG